MNVVRLAVVAALMSWLLGSFHLIGAVLVTMIGILVAKCMALVRMRRVMETPFLRLLPWKNLGGILIAAMIAAIASLVVNAGMDLPSVYLLPVSGVVYLLVYGGLILMSGLLTAPEKSAVKRSLYVWNRWNHESRREAGL
jgi:hypothetical protein